MTQALSPTEHAGSKLFVIKTLHWRDRPVLALRSAKELLRWRNLYRLPHFLCFLRLCRKRGYTVVNTTFSTYSSEQYTVLREHQVTKNVYWARICNSLRGQGIYSEESIPPGRVSIPGLLFKRFTNTVSVWKFLIQPADPMSKLKINTFIFAGYFLFIMFLK
jgi:hypothetical protein